MTIGNGSLTAPYRDQTRLPLTMPPREDGRRAREPSPPVQFFAEVLLRSRLITHRRQS
jgi:hypothetical protein